MPNRSLSIPSILELPQCITRPTPGLKSEVAVHSRGTHEKEELLNYYSFAHVSSSSMCKQEIDINLKHLGNPNLSNVIGMQE